MSMDLRNQILERVKTSDKSIAEISHEHGIGKTTIYEWLRESTGESPARDLIKLTKENKELKQIIGELTVQMGRQQKKGVAIEHKKLHEIFEVSRSSLYYKSKKYEEDLKVKKDIEKVWIDHSSYGHKRLAIELKLNKKRILRVMKKFNIKPYRRHRKPFKRSNVSIYDKYSNLLVSTSCIQINQIWVTDFTYLWYKNRFIYVATVMDI
jgi:transposase-like protein